MKKVLIIGLVVLVLGAALFGAGWYLTGGDFSALDGNVGKLQLRFGTGRNGFSGVRGEQREPEMLFGEKQYSFSAAGVEKLKLVERNSPLRVTASPDREIHLICRENEEYCYTITNEGGVLRMERKDSEAFVLDVFGRDWDGVTELQLPAGLGGEIELTCNNDSISFDALRLDAQATLEADSQNGRIEAGGLTAADITLTSQNGRVEAEDIQAARLTVKSQNGSVSLTDCAAGDSIHARSGNGSVHVDGISAGHSIHLESTNGSVKGTLAGSIRDYTVTASAKNGSSSLPERYGRGDIELRVNATNGSIDLEFAED